MTSWSTRRRTGPAERGGEHLPACPATSPRTSTATPSRSTRVEPSLRAGAEILASSRTSRGAGASTPASVTAPVRRCTFARGRWHLETADGATDGPTSSSPRPASSTIRVSRHRRPRHVPGPLVPSALGSRRVDRASGSASSAGIERDPDRHGGRRPGGGAHPLPADAAVDRAVGEPGLQRRQGDVPPHALGHRDDPRRGVARVHRRLRERSHRRRGPHATGDPRGLRRALATAPTPPSPPARPRSCSPSRSPP